MKRFVSCFAAVAFAALLLPVHAHAQTSRPVVADIRAVPLGTERVEVSWSLPSPAVHGLLVYRDSRPVTSVAGLRSIAALPGTARTYTDVLPDRREYYYAVITVVVPEAARTDAPRHGAGGSLYYDEELDAPGYAHGGTAVPYDMVLPGVNATVTGIALKEEAPPAVDVGAAQRSVQESRAQKGYGADELREQPLPYQNPFGAPMAKGGTISPRSQEGAAALVTETRAAPQKRALDVHVFENESSPAGSADDAQLQAALGASFLQHDYAGAVGDLKAFLSGERATGAQARAIFYLGEAYYYSGMLPEALTQFLLVQDAFPALCRRWIRSTLDLYEIPD